MSNHSPLQTLPGQTKQARGGDSIPRRARKGAQDMGTLGGSNGEERSLNRRRPLRNNAQILKSDPASLGG